MENDSYLTEARRMINQRIEEQDDKKDDEDDDKEKKKKNDKKKPPSSPKKKKNDDDNDSDEDDDDDNDDDEDDDDEEKNKKNDKKKKGNKKSESRRRSNRRVTEAHGLGQLTPAYGRDYRSRDDVLAAFDDDEDFVTERGETTSKSELQKLQVESVKLRYDRSRKIIPVTISKVDGGAYA